MLNTIKLAIWGQNAQESVGLKRILDLAVIYPILILFNLSRHLAVAELTRMAKYRDLLKLQPTFRYKYLSSLYLARGMGLADRYRAQTYHYRFFDRIWDAALIDRVFHQGVPVYQAERNGNSYAMLLRLSVDYFYEGEFSLHFTVDGEVIYIFSFTVVPGSVLGLAAERAMLVTRQQGVRTAFDKIRQATRDFDDVSPKFMLFHALQGLAMGLGIRTIGGVSGARHISNRDPASAIFLNAYDDFFISLGAIANASGFLCLSLPLREKPLKFIAREHRSRTVRRRRFKGEVARIVRHALPVPHSSD